MKTWQFKIISFALLLSICCKTFSQNTESIVKCKPKSFILNESFDATTFPPTGWLNIPGSGSYVWQRTTIGSNPVCSPHSGAAMAMFNSYNANAGSYALLITPAFNLTGNTGDFTLKFWMYHDNQFITSIDKIDIYINTTPNLTGATLLGTTLRTTGFDWLPHVFSFPATFNTSTNYVIFKGVSAYGNNLFMDDITINDHENDVGIDSIIVPSSTIISGTYAPQVIIKNYGTIAQTNIPVKYKIGTSGSPLIQIIPSLAAGATINVSFPPWNATIGYYNFIFYTDLAGDCIRENDTIKRIVQVLSNTGWSSVANTPLSGYMGSAATFNRKIYCMGGYQPVNSGAGVAIYDEPTDTWSTGPSLPENRTEGMATSSSSKIYYLGGSNGSSFQNNVWELTPPSSSWITKTPLPNNLGWAGTVNFQDSLIYIVGGFNGSTAQNTVYLYNSNNNTWRTCTPLPEAVYGGICCLMSENVIVYAGGSDNTGIHSTTYLGTINAGNHANITWSTGSDMPLPTIRAGAGSFDHIMILATGGNSMALIPSVPSPTYSYYNIWGIESYKITPTLGSYVSMMKYNGSGIMYYKLFCMSGYTGASCTNISEVYTVQTLLPGFNNFEKLNFKLYPNPAQNSVIINQSDNQYIHGSIITILNLQGQTLVQQPVAQNNTTMNITALPDGIYIVKLVLSNGQAAQQKFVVIK